MDNPYNVDDILDEMKKHRENSSEIQEEDKNTDEENVQESEPEAEVEPKSETETETELKADESGVDESETPTDENPQETAEDETGIKEDENTSEPPSYEDDAANIFDVFDDDEQLAASSEEGITSDLAIMPENEKTVKKKWRQTKKGKILISIIIVLVVIILGLCVVAGLYVNNVLNTLTATDEQVDSIKEWTGMDELVESFNEIYESSDVYSYRDMVKTWYYTGVPCSSTHVLNIMLIGEDTRNKNITDEGTRADSAIVASLNIDTGEITLTSILRDCYAYYEVTAGDDSTGQFGKINGAMAYGGIDCYIRCVENMFKIDIDNYVIVNFTSFEKIIDAMGGIEVEMTQAEINEINNHPSTYGNVTIDGSAGTLLLSGEQALAYCRIRHIDSDNVRADRQKTVLLNIFEKAKSQSSLNIAKLVKTFLPYVKTGYSKSELLSIATYGLSNGWLSYDTQTYTAPTNSTDENGNTITTCKGGTYYNQWCWLVDYPLLSQIVQTNIYGKTNIVLSESRPNFLNLSL